MLHPKCLFPQYRNAIKELNTIDKASIQNNKFCLFSDTNSQIYYAPHNEYINENAKILIVGITPGWSQTQRAYQVAQTTILQGFTDEQVCYQCKMESRFAGSMRKNLIAMLDELLLSEKLNIPSCVELFKLENTLLHTTSLIKYPFFYKGKNYSGYAPSIGSSSVLRQCVETLFVEELNCLKDVRLIIPLGTAVEQILRESHIMPQCNVLWGFPHPSGLNAHRKDLFNQHYESMLSILEKSDFGGCI